MTDKQMTEEDVVAEMRDGMTIGIAGWGSRRKPMSIVRAILRSDLQDLTIVAYGGPEVGMLCTTGQATKIVYGFVSLDSIALEPHFRAARQNGTIEAMELDEGMLQWGLRAAAMRVDFLPCRAGLGSAVRDNNPGLKLVDSPYGDDREVRQRRPQDRAHDRHRLAPRSPARDPDCHPVAQLRNDVFLGHPLVGHLLVGHPIRHCSLTSVPCSTRPLLAPPPTACGGHAAPKRVKWG